MSGSRKIRQLMLHASFLYTAHMKTLLLLYHFQGLHSSFPKKSLCDPPDQIFAGMEGIWAHQSHLVYLQVNAHTPSICHFAARSWHSKGNTQKVSWWQTKSNSQSTIPAVESGLNAVSRSVLISSIFYRQIMTTPKHCWEVVNWHIWKHQERMEPWLAGLSGLGVVQYTERLQVPYLVRGTCLVCELDPQ